MQKKEDFFTKQENNKGFSSWVIRQPEKKKKASWIRGILILIALAVGAYFYKDLLFTQNIRTTNESSSRRIIGSTIQEEGILRADGDILTYTHTLTTKNGDKYLLKSKTVPINNYSNTYSGVLQIIGTLETIYQNLPLVEVEAIGTEVADLNGENGSWESHVSKEDSSIIYIKNIGLWFGSDFFEEYAFVGEAWQNWEITVKNLDTNISTTITSFACTKSWDTNCKELTRTFNATAVKKINTAHGNTFYKLPEIKSWYFQNGERWGYFINDSEDAEVEALSELIVIPNKDFIANLVNTYGLTTCLGEDAHLSTITSHEVKKTAQGLEVIITGKGEKNFSCQTIVDLSTPSQLVFQDVAISTNETNETQNQNSETSLVHEQTPETTSETKKPENTTEIAKTTTSNINSDVKQFPINKEKSMTYNSSRWEYSITFPSSNISYSANGVDEDFGQTWVRCTYATKVIQYPDRENLQSTPSVIIYECKAKDGLTSPEGSVLQELWDKKFVIKVLNPAWWDFANNIEIASF